MGMTTQAYFLVAHGSRRPQSERDLNCLADYLRTLLADSPEDYVGTGCLEFQSCSLAEQLIQFHNSLPVPCHNIHILPVFLLPGNHVRVDIPAELQFAQAQLQSSQTQFILNPHVGSHPALKRVLRQKMASAQFESWILVGHGSRRPAGNRAIKQLAHSLNAHPAFWAHQPSLSDQVKHLIDQGVGSVGVLPYFLFSGKITAAIADQVTSLAQHYPQQVIELLSPLEPSAELAAALLDLTEYPAIEVSIPA